MANRRMINRDDFESMAYGSLTIRQRHLFNGAMLHSDDDGIMAVRLVKSRVLPYDDDISIDEIFRDLKKLEEQNFIILYEKDEYLQVCDWRKRQNIRKQLYKKTIHPIPPKYEPLKNDDENKCAYGATQRGKKGNQGKFTLGENSKYGDSGAAFKSYPDRPL